MTTIPNLPPNPFSRQPIRTRERLAGRADELERIRYYLRLTAADDSPHLALIGSRGAGKTSLLNVTATIAREEHLLVVRLDLNEGMTSSSGGFWKDFYAALLLACGEAGLWGGFASPIHTALFQMIHARRLSEPDEMVLQFPVALATATMSLNDFHCSDPLIVRDVGVTLAEARRGGYRGMVVLIDEADCLGRSVELIQVCRNVFQRTPGCSLVLAGTEAVFPTLTEVFSPIPRQFYRIDVKPFDTSWATEEFMRRGLETLSSDQREQILPNRSVAHELHDLCGGEPSELQLYCHHMYLLLESGKTQRMALLPEVFRAVLREYRANTPADLGAVLRKIEDLPESLLCGRRWLRRHGLTLTENVEVAQLREELKLRGPLDESAKTAIKADVVEAYGELHRLGVTEGPESLCLIGGAFTRGFWKAFVEADKGKRWSWDDSDFGRALLAEVSNDLHSTVSPDLQWSITRRSASERPLDEVDPVSAVEELRRGSVPKRVPIWYTLGDVLLKARKADEDFANEIVVEASARGREVRTFVYRLGHFKGEEFAANLLRWQSSRGAVLEAHGIAAATHPARLFRVPSDEELLELTRFRGHPGRGVYGCHGATEA